MLRVGAYLFPYLGEIFLKGCRTFRHIMPFCLLLRGFFDSRLCSFFAHSKTSIQFISLLIAHFKIAVNRLLSDDDTRIKVSALRSVAILLMMIQVGIDTEIVKSQPVFAQVYDFKLVGIEMFKEGYGDSHIPIIIIRNVTYPVHIDSIEIVKMPMVAWNVGNMKMQERSNLFRVRQISEPSNGCDSYKVLFASLLMIDDVPCDNILIRNKEGRDRNCSVKAKTHFILHHQNEDFMGGDIGQTSGRG